MTNTLEQTLSTIAQDYWATGYAILRSVFSPDEVKTWKAEADRLLHSELVHPDNIRTRPRPVGDKLVVERIDPIIDVSPLFKSVLFDERILAPLRAIFEEEPVLFKDKLIFKLPGMSGYQMHQDYAWWQPQSEDSILKGVGPDDILSVAIAIDPADEANGALELFPNYHRSLLTPPGVLKNMTEEEAAACINLDKGTLAKTQPGDVIIFHSLAPHRSQDNNSPRSRSQLYMTYNKASKGDLYNGQQDHYRTYTIKGMASENERARAYFK